MALQSGHHLGSSLLQEFLPLMFTPCTTVNSLAIYYECTNNSAVQQSLKTAKWLSRNTILVETLHMIGASFPFLAFLRHAPPTTTLVLQNFAEDYNYTGHNNTTVASSDSDSDSSTACSSERAAFSKPFALQKSLSKLSCSLPGVVISGASEIKASCATFVLWHSSGWTAALYRLWSYKTSPATQWQHSTFQCSVLAHT